jgi:hypothetical protein
MREGQKIDDFIYDFEGNKIKASVYCRKMGLNYQSVRSYKYKHKCDWYTAIGHVKSAPKKITYHTRLSIIKDNIPITFIPFNLGVSDKELRQELIQEFTDLELPLNLIDKCIKEGYLIYDGYYVSIVNIK